MLKFIYISVSDHLLEGVLKALVSVTFPLIKSTGEMNIGYMPSFSVI